MKNIDKLRQMTDEELSDFFCDAMEKIAAETDADLCDICPVRSRCKKGHTGFLAWLNSETDIITENKKGQYNI